MLQNNPLSTDSAEPLAAPATEPVFTVPGKVFLLGEYAVLAGSPAVVAAVPPRFALRLSRESGFGSSFHPQSPAAKLLSWAERVGAPEDLLAAVGTPGAFEDSHGGHGGFGGSTAEFALVYRAIADSHQLQGFDRDWQRVWKLYRELTRPSQGSTLSAPSGADLVAQWQGGVVLFGIGDESGPTCERLDSARTKFDFSTLLVFSAAGQQGRKVSTHQHLDASSALKSVDALESLAMSLDPALDAGITALRAGDPIAFGAAMNAYGDALRAAGLEIEATRRDREALSRLPGVVGVKGAGALQADAVIVALTPNANREPVIRAAEARGLVLVRDGITHEPGIQFSP